MGTIDKRAHVIAGLMRVAAVIIFIASFVCPAGASSSYGADDLFTAGFGSRPYAMGSAFTALGGDASAAFYNPAGLNNLEKQQVSLMHYPLGLNTLYNSAAYAQPVFDFGSIGLGICRIYTGDIPVYDSSDVPAGYTSFEEYKGTVSYAKKTGYNTAFGVNINVFTMSLMKTSAVSFGADLGFLYEPFSFLSAGFMVRNILKPVYAMSGGREELPQTYTAGVALKLALADYNLNITFDCSKGETTNGVMLRGGVEGVIYGVAALRAGYDDGRLAFGGGLKLWDAVLDYAYSTDQYSGGLSRFTLSYNFGMTLDEQKKSRETELKFRVKELVEREFRKKEAAKAKIIIDRAYALYKEGSFDKALEDADKALAWSKDYPDALTLKKLIGRRAISGHYEKALKAYNRGDIVSSLEGFKNVYALDSGYRDVDYYIEKLNTKMSMKSAAKAHFIRGVELYVDKQYDKAKESLSMALSIEPSNKVIRTYLEKATVQMKLAAGGPGLAGGQSEKVKKLYYTGLKLYTAGDLKNAIVYWKQAIEMDPDDIRVMKSIEKAQVELTELQKIGVNEDQGAGVK